MVSYEILNPVCRYWGIEVSVRFWDIELMQSPFDKTIKKTNYDNCITYCFKDKKYDKLLNEKILQKIEEIEIEISEKALINSIDRISTVSQIKDYIKNLDVKLSAIEISDITMEFL